MTVIVTGYNGLLGAALVKTLKGSLEVVCLGRTPPVEQTGVAYVDADLATRDIARHLPAKANAVFHLAQAAGYNKFPEMAETVSSVNVGAVSQLLAWAERAKVRHFVHASTGGVYGTSVKPFVETDPVRIEGPLAHYLATKRSAELLAEAYSRQFVVTALRYFFIYGPGQKSEMLMPRLIASVRNGTPIRLAGQNGIDINPIYVDDAATATAALLQREHCGVINIAGPERLSLRDIGNQIGNAVGRAPMFEVTDGVPGHVVADIAKMRADLHVPTVRFRDGVKGMCV